MNTNPFDEYAKLQVIQGRVVASLDGWQITNDQAAVDVWKAVTHASDTTVWAMEYQSCRKSGYLTELCRAAKEEIPVWNIRARRQFDKNMIQWLSAKEAELEKAAEEKILHANQQ